MHPNAPVSSRALSSSRRAALVLAITIVSVLGLAGLALAVITPSPALTIAQAIASSSVTVTDASFVSVPPSGTPNGVSTSVLTGFPLDGPDFGILTSGDVNKVDDAGTFADTDDGGGTVRGDSDLDVTILKIDLVIPAGANCLSFNFRFLSEEFPDFVGSPFNDAFIAELDTSDWTTSGSAISAPHNFAFDANGDVVSINSTGIGNMTAANGAGTAFDGNTTGPEADPEGGATTLLGAATPVTPGAHSLYLSIFDQGDNALDSAVFLDNLRVGSVPNPAVDCVPGATQPAQLTLTKTVDNTGGGTAVPTDWTLSATGPTTISGSTGSPAVTNAVVAPGTYTLSESGPPGYAPTDWSCTGGTLTGSSLVLAAGATASCSISNVFSPTASADLAITKTDAPDPATVGASLTYTLTVTNAGPDAAAGVMVTDSLPATVAFVSATPSQGVCSGTTTVSCNLGTIDPAGSATVAITVTPTTDADLSNTATVSSATSDPNSANNTDTEATVVDPAPTETAASGTKYYDANANGQLDPGEAGIGDWLIDYGDGTTSASVLTDADGNFIVTLDPGDYTFAERQAGSPWVQTGNSVDQSGGTGDVTLNPDMTYSVTLDPGETATGLNFGNVCLGADGGRTKGFWGNKNGQALIGADDLALLVSLNLVSENGSAFDPVTAAEVRTWLQDANARNMAYMLSAQLAAMALNVHNGFVDGAALVHAPDTTSANAAGFATIDALLAEASAELGLHPTALPGDAWRAYQEALKDALDNANNNLTFVQADASACPTPVFGLP